MTAAQETSAQVKEAARQAAVTRMLNGEPFTYAGIGAVVSSCGAHEGRDRIADRTIQRWRRKGWIAFTREGRSVVWRLTELGVAQAPEGENR